MNRSLAILFCILLITPTYAGTAVAADLDVSIGTYEDSAVKVSDGETIEFVDPSNTARITESHGGIEVDFGD